MTEFPISGVETYWWLPPLVAFAISSLTATGGLSGAFLLLPFQVSVLGFTGPAVSPTNLIFNVMSTPSGVYGYYKERRMVWPLAWTIAAASLPGMFLGAIIRVKLLSDTASFKPFVGLVLAYIGYKLLKDIFGGVKVPTAKNTSREDLVVTSPNVHLSRVEFSFNGQRYSVKLWGVFLLALIVGVIGGIYGIGGGAIIAPFLITVFGLPVYTVAGASLLGNFASSVSGILMYLLVALFLPTTDMPITPDWQLGALFGLGGIPGVYLGARLQRFIPARLIKGFLVVCVLFVAIAYLT
jgi:uncharacterized membrane protein YfcA